MPAKTKKPCRYRGCPKLTVERHGYCSEHESQKSWGRWQKEKGTPTQRGYGREWQKLRLVILRRDQYLCCECRKNGIFKAGNHVDHVISKSRGGDDSPGNLQTLCKRCHEAKTAVDK